MIQEEPSHTSGSSVTKEEKTTSKVKSDNVYSFPQELKPGKLARSRPRRSNEEDESAARPRLSTRHRLIAISP